MHWYKHPSCLNEALRIAPRHQAVGGHHLKTGSQLEGHQIPRLVPSKLADEFAMSLYQRVDPPISPPPANQPPQPGKSPANNGTSLNIGGMDSSKLSNF
jgi:hypothetical protein